MKKRLILISCAFIIVVAAWSTTTSRKTHALKDVLKDKFLIGTAMNANQISGVDSKSNKIIKTHFNAIVAENCMKSGPIQPQEGVFDFSLADQFVNFGIKNNMFVTGHVLIWHSQAPSWFFKDKNGNDVSREVLIQRMKDHIITVVTRYKGKIKGWDVVNEAIEDDGSFRKSKFYQIIGEDFIRLAFEFAHQADPNAELYYNDYSMALPKKREAVVNLVRSLKSKGVRIDAVGMQGHMTMNFPTISEEEKSIVAYAEQGVKVMITELDITVLPSPGKNVGAEVSLNYQYNKELNPYPDSLPDVMSKKLHDRYMDFFNLFLKHQDKISRVTLWGVTDSQSWRNDWPVKGRTDYPLLFDRNYKPKSIVYSIIKAAKQIK